MRKEIYTFDSVNPTKIIGSIYQALAEKNIGQGYRNMLINMHEAEVNDEPFLIARESTDEQVYFDTEDFDLLARGGYIRYVRENVLRDNKEVAETNYFIDYKENLDSKAQRIPFFDEINEETFERIKKLTGIKKNIQPVLGLSSMSLVDALEFYDPAVYDIYTVDFPIYKDFCNWLDIGYNDLTVTSVLGKPTHVTKRYVEVSDTSPKNIDDLLHEFKKISDAEDYSADVTKPIYVGLFKAMSRIQKLYDEKDIDKSSFDLEIGNEHWLDEIYDEKELVKHLQKCRMKMFESVDKILTNFTGERVQGITTKYQLLMQSLARNNKKVQEALMKIGGQLGED